MSGSTTQCDTTILYLTFTWHEEVYRKCTITNSHVAAAVAGIVAVVSSCLVNRNTIRLTGVL